MSIWVPATCAVLGTLLAVWLVWDVHRESQRFKRINEQIEDWQGWERRPAQNHLDVHLHDWLIDEEREALKAAALTPFYRGGVRGSQK